MKAHDVSSMSSLEALQSTRQRDLLDAIDQLRNCGMHNELSLPQLVVCGDQSAGKSSVLEALTELNFPRSDNLCTRFATEIVLRRSKTERLSVRIIPDDTRSASEQKDLQNFNTTTSDFTQITSHLAQTINEAQKAMGIGLSIADMPTRTFARDVLSIEIEGPTRPQLTVVDLPGLIQNENTTGDKQLVDDLTRRYIHEPRAICLAIITAKNDADNQRILTMVKKADPEGVRSLGIITKPDTLPPGSGNEKSFIELAKNQNKNYFFKLGWHVVKNRKFEESDVSFDERNRLEREYFHDSNFKEIPGNSLGIDTLRTRLSSILFEHVSRELPEMRKEVTKMLETTTQQLDSLGLSRTSAEECREYLIQVSEKMKDTCKRALSGTYEGAFFQSNNVLDFDSDSPSAIRRLRALIQVTNEEFAQRMREQAHTLQIEPEEEGGEDYEDRKFASDEELEILQDIADEPLRITYAVALAWIEKMMARNRGRELYGNYNPMLISELFWFQSRKWESLARDHIDRVATISSEFLHDLLDEVCSQDVRDNIWTQYLEDSLKAKESEAYDYLKKIMRSYRDHPINHNHYYTDTVQKIRRRRDTARARMAVESATQKVQTLNDARRYQTLEVVEKEGFLDAFSVSIETSQLLFVCEEALDCMRAIYKVKQKVFIDIVLTLVAEEHIFRDLENVFSPQAVSRMANETVELLAAEPEGINRERIHHQNQLEKLSHGQKILKKVIGR